MISFLCYRSVAYLPSCKLRLSVFMMLFLAMRSLPHQKKNPLRKLIWGSALIKYQHSAPRDSVAVLLAVLDYLDAPAEAATSELEVCRD